ncbi:hypothetical protein [Bartonella senegalensis]|uniref:hypothetical protein n=1 Tax=Bartonella senegalensis TaxID=1468418 RepID=UPI0002E09771|nr:hypothetical protein [Bartonella senegalensis]
MFFCKTEAQNALHQQDYSLVKKERIELANLASPRGGEASKAMKDPFADIFNPENQKKRPF